MSKRITVTVDFTLEVPDDTDTEAVTMDFDRCDGKTVGFDDYRIAFPHKQDAPKQTAKLISWETTCVEEEAP